MNAIKKVLSCETNKQRVLSLILLAVLSGVVSVGLDLLLHVLFLGPVSNGSYSNTGWIIFFFSVLLIASSFFVFRHVSKKDPSYLFLSITLILTVSFSVTYSVNIVSWDQGVHYQVTYDETDFSGDVEVTPAVEKELNDTNIYLSIAELEDKIYQLDNVDSAGEERAIPRHHMSTQQRIASLPAAAIMEACQLLGTPFSFSYVFPKLIYALLYSLITFFGMRRLKSGKMLYAAIALLPTALFLAANYSYDYWINAFSLFGFACLVGAIQSNEQLKPKTIALMLGALVVGFMPKAIYFPLLLLCLLIPKNLIGDGSKKSINIYRVAVCACSLFLLVSFALPMLVGGVESDTRGYGSVVNSSEQIKFILREPFHYFAILTTFLSDYLSPFTTASYSNFFAYLGKVEVLSIVTLVAFVSLTIVDRDVEDDKRLCTARNVICAVVLFFITVSLVASALYISFTPVAAEEILGCQSRYLIPLLFPLLAFIGFPSLLRKVPALGTVRTAKYFNVTVLAVLSLSALITQWIVCSSLIY